MPDYYTKMLKELKDLSAKIKRLSDFIGASLTYDKMDKEQKNLIELQLDSMKHYRDILERRIVHEKDVLISKGFSV